MAIKKFGQTSIENIRLLEKKYNVKLPNDYIEFLLRYNGGDVVLDDDNDVYVGEQLFYNRYIYRFN